MLTCTKDESHVIFVDVGKCCFYLAGCVAADAVIKAGTIVRNNINSLTIIRFMADASASNPTYWKATSMEEEKPWIVFLFPPRFSLAI